MPGVWPNLCAHVNYITWMSDSDKRVASTAGGEVVFRFWSLEPNDYEGVIPTNVYPTLDVEYSPKEPGGAPVRERYELKKRC